jgi:hypothetical protein
MYAYNLLSYCHLTHLISSEITEPEDGYNAFRTNHSVQAFPSIYLRPFSALKTAYIRVLKSYEYNFLMKKTDRIELPLDDEKDSSDSTSESEEEEREVKRARIET